MRPKVFSWPAADRNGICEAQQLGAAGALRINGVLATWLPEQVGTNGSAVAYFPNIQRTVTIYSGGNLSGVSFTVAGRDGAGASVTETLSGPNNTTVETTAEFQVVTSVTADAAVASNVEIGTGDQGSTDPWRHNHRLNPANNSLWVDVTGTMDVDVQYTASLEAPFVWTDHPTMSGLYADAVGNIAFPCTYVRALVNTSSTGSMTFTVIQSG